MPSSVCTAMRVWTESSGLISADQPPFGLSPMSGAATMERIFRYSWAICCSSKGRGGAAVHHQDLPRHVLRIVRAEEEGGTRHVGRLAEAAERDAPVFHVDVAEPVGIIFMRAIGEDRH